METTTNVCTACWQGIYVNGMCQNCHSQQTENDNRRSDALPLMDIVHGIYCVGDVLGKGGYGITYSAWDNMHMRRVALKELFPSTSVSRCSNGRDVIPNRGHEDYFTELKGKFAEEAQRPQRLAEECKAVKVYDLFQCNNTVYYAMEYLEGCDLRVYQKRNGLLSWDFLAPIMRQLLDTLAILHKENLIHRDISPDNIFLTKDGQVKLIDFGAARAYQGTLNFTVQKKASFAPWEQMESDGNQGPWTDLYALSVTMYMLLSGKLPPKAQDRIYGKPVIPLDRLCPDLPIHVVKTIEKGMSIRIRDRYLSAEEYIQALFPVNRSRGTLHKGLEQQRVYWLRGKNGYYAGQKKRLALKSEIRFGRWHTNDITFPESTLGVSRYQCVLLIDDEGNVFVKDAGSSYGTFLNEIKVGKNWTGVNPGDCIHFGNEEFLLICQM